MMRCTANDHDRLDFLKECDSHWINVKNEPITPLKIKPDLNTDECETTHLLAYIEVILNVTKNDAKDDTSCQKMVNKHLETMHQIVNGLSTTTCELGHFSFAMFRVTVQAIFEHFKKDAFDQKKEQAHLIAFSRLAHHLIQCHFLLKKHKKNIACNMNTKETVCELFSKMGEVAQDNKENENSTKCHPPLLFHIAIMVCLGIASYRTFFVEGSNRANAILTFMHKLILEKESFFMEVVVGSVSENNHIAITVDETSNENEFKVILG